MDAIAVLMPLFNSSVKHYYVIEGDLQSYFDAVHHRTLMKLTLCRTCHLATHRSSQLQTV